MNQKQLAEKRAEEGVCIVCGKADDRIARGLCVTHWNRWDKQRKAISEAQRQAYDDRLIEEGYLLPSRRGRRPVSDDVFAELAADFLLSAETAQHQAKKSTRKPSDQQAADLVDQAAKKQDELEKKPKGRARKKRGAK